jgi:integrase/recombinase XerD
MSTHRRSSPSQEALALPDWPKADRETWQAAQEAAGALDDGGAASHLNALTLQDLTRRYAYFLSFVAQKGELDHLGPAGATVTEQNIRHYLRYLEQHVSSVTLSQSIYKISRVAHFLAPGRDWHWLRRLARRLKLRAKPRDKRNDVVPIKELFQLGLRLMDQAERIAKATNCFRALLYRDGLIIAILAADPLRLANITALEIGRTLINDGTTWSLNIPPEETKSGRLHLAVLPDWAARCIDRYVQYHRPYLANVESTNRLWLSQVGRPLTDDGLYQAVCKRTHDAFGKPINPHLFRSCLATSTAVHHGAQMGLAMTVLDHTSSKVTERYYNQARMIDAVQAYQEIVLADLPNLAIEIGRTGRQRQRSEIPQ